MTPRLALEPARDERSVTVAAAAERLGCDPTTIRELLRKELLAGVRIGKTDTSRTAFEQRNAKALPAPSKD